MSARLDGRLPRAQPREIVNDSRVFDWWALRDSNPGSFDLESSARPGYGLPTCEFPQSGEAHHHPDALRAAHGGEEVPVARPDSRRVAEVRTSARDTGGAGQKFARSEGAPGTPARTFSAPESRAVFPWRGSSQGLGQNRQPGEFLNLGGCGALLLDYDRAGAVGGP